MLVSSLRSVFARAALALALLALLGGAARAATLVVTSNADTGGTTCSTTCTLRQAIGAANLTATADIINFAIPTPIKSEILISPASALPQLTQPVTINGYSQSLTAVNNQANTSNAKLRIRIDGISAGPGISGLSICANATTIKGLSITRFSGNAIRVECGVTGAIIAGNFIGLGTDGVTSLGGQAGNSGIFVFHGVTTVGGASVADRNVIAWRQASGVLVSSSDSAGTQVLNNLIGTDKSGSLDRGGDRGITLSTDATGVVIGSTSAPNLMAFNDSGLVPDAVSASGNTFYANRFDNNDQLGIDFLDNGVTANDVNDVDAGPNGLQNFPLLNTANRIAGGLSVTGSIDIGGTTGLFRTFNIALYASAGCDASGNGEGERFLGVASRVLRINIDETFSINLTTSDALPSGTVITATATDPVGSTSEFSDCFELDPPPLVVNSTADPGDGTCNVSNCTLREAITTVNAGATGTFNSISFNIPGAGPHTISPTSPLPTIVRTVTIDGYSQPGAVANSLATGDDAVIKIRLDGANAGINAAGFALCDDADGSVVRGLSLTGFNGSGIDIGAGCATSSPDNVLVQGNFIGLAPDGTTAAGNGAGGVRIIGGTGSLVGGSDPADRNVIGGNTSSSLSHGVIIVGSTSGTRVDGNYIGTDRTGTLARGNSGRGVLLSGGTDNVQIGNGSPNLIAFNALQGVSVFTASTGNQLYANHVRNNVGLGIDLCVTNGNACTGTLTPNDADDVDGGGNNLQNFPELIKAERSAAGIKLAGTLDVPVGTSNAAYTIAAYASAACDASGNGEGERFLGTKIVNLTQLSNESFAFDLATDDPLGPGTQITTTATDANGNTSEFSTCIAATDAPPGFVVTSNADTDGTTCGPTCTLRQAINAANLQVGADLISFDIPGTGPFTISPTTALPTITEAVTINGYSQIGSAPNTLDSGSNAVLLIDVDGGDTITNGLVACADDVSIRGLAFTRFAQAHVRLGSVSCAGPYTGMTLAGSFIGLAPDGAAAGNTGAIGVAVAATQALVGGVEPSERNVIGSVSFGISVTLPGTDGTQVLNNTVGLDPTGLVSRGNSGFAINFDQSATGVTIGSEIAPNRLAFSAAGIRLTTTVTGIRFFANEFVSNVNLGIDLLASSGVTPNDLNDGDAGANDLQNFPVLQSALAESGSLIVAGTLDVPVATANAPYTLAFYESTACDVSGNGEGEIFLGSAVKNLSGNAESFSVTLAITPPVAGHVLTATATDPNGNTSEFSACFTAPPINTVFSDGFESP